MSDISLTLKKLKIPHTHPLYRYGHATEVQDFLRHSPPSSWMAEITTSSVDGVWILPEMTHSEKFPKILFNGKYQGFSTWSRWRNILDNYLSPIWSLLQCITFWLLRKHCVHWGWAHFFQFNCCLFQFFFASCQKCFIYLLYICCKAKKLLNNKKIYKICVDKTNTYQSSVQLWHS